MRQFKFVLIAALALIVGLSSCSKNESNPGGKTEKSLLIKMGFGEKTRGESTPVGNVAATFTTGNLYLVTSTGVITGAYTIADVGADITLAQIAAGYKITNVSAQTTGVVVVGNVAGLTAAAGKNISTVKSESLAIASQTDTDFGVTTAALYGEGDSFTLVSPDVYSVAVEIKPLIGRIEISDITSGGDITGFKVEGIFINNFYPTFLLSGTPPALVDNGSIAAMYVEGVASYPSGGGPLHDYKTIGGVGTLVGKVVSPATGKVWSYNMFEAKTAEKMPHIIVRLTDITTTSGNTYPSPSFLTITKYIQTTGGAALLNFEAGKVYEIETGKFTFTEDDLTTNPYDKDFELEVKVTVWKWVTEGITPVL